MIKTSKAISLLIKEYLAEQSVQKVSRRAYARHLKLFFEWSTVTGKRPDALTRADVLEYREHLIEEKSDTTALSYLITVKSFYKWIDAQNYGENICKGVPNVPKYKGYKKDVLTADQVIELMNTPASDSIKDKRDRAILALLCQRGLRTIEVSRMNIGDIIEKQTKEGSIWGIMTQRKGKLKKNDFIPITGDILDTINEYLADRDDVDNERPLFVNHALGIKYNGFRVTSDNISRMVKARLRSIGIDSPRITAHSLRHTVGVLLINEGFDLLEVSLYLGHSSTEVTEIYTRMSEDLKRHQNKAGKAISKLFHR